MLVTVDRLRCFAAIHVHTYIVSVNAVHETQDLLDSAKSLNENIFFRTR